MQCRTFLKHSGTFAVGMGVFGTIHRNGTTFIGDTPTTTDILGPFYRPGAPFRTNLNPPDFTGEILHLSGRVYREDGKPASNCLIEIWQCKPDTFYDNVSDDFLYRASQQTKKDGAYRFVTAIPIPYPVEDNPGAIRPAHIHMRISAPDQMDLITQLYLKDDPYLATDPSGKSELSLHRILTVRKTKPNESELTFDVVLKKQYPLDDSVFRKVSGVYKMNDQSRMEFYRDGDFLFYKTNHQINGSLTYNGNNTFVGGVNDTEARFELLPGDNATVHFRLSRRRETRLEGKKVLDYSK